MGKTVTQFKPGFIPWNKGLSVRLNPRGEFKKGSIPWNKGHKSFLIHVQVKKPGWKINHGWLCQQCKHIFWQWRRQKYCSKRCQSLTQIVPRRQCKVCGQPCSLHAHFYCSNECRAKDLIKDKHPSWKGGIQKERDKRKSYEMQMWRKLVYSRDDFTCQRCFIRGNTLEAHHIFPYAFFPNFRDNLYNGMTLCKDCHKTFNSISRQRKLITINN